MVSQSDLCKIDRILRLDFEKRRGIGDEDARLEVDARVVDKGVCLGTDSLNAREHARAIWVEHHEAVRRKMRDNPFAEMRAQHVGYPPEARIARLDPVETVVHLEVGDVEEDRVARTVDSARAVVRGERAGFLVELVYAHEAGDGVAFDACHTLPHIHEEQGPVFAPIDANMPCGAFDLHEVALGATNRERKVIVVGAGISCRAVDAVAQAGSGPIGCHTTKAPARELRELREVIAFEQLEHLLAGKGNALLGICRDQAERAGNDIENAMHVCCLGHMFRTTLSFSGTKTVSLHSTRSGT